MARAEPRQVLRIAVIHAGRITTERLFHPDDTVTIGTDPANALVVPDNPVTGERFVLFEPDVDGVRLHFTRGFGGRSKLASEGRTTELGALKTGSEGLFLDPSYRGKLELGPVIVLFQFVAPPPVPVTAPPPRLDFRAPLLETDPELLGSLGSWSAIALLISVWVWTSPPPRAVDVVGFQERLAHLQPAIVVPPPAPEVLVVEEVDAVEIPVARTEPAPAPVPVDRPSSGGGEPAPSREDIQRELIAGSRLLERLIGQTGPSGDAVARAWDGGGVEDLDAALAEHRGVTADADDALRGGARGGSGEAASIGQLAHRGAVGTGDGIGGGPVPWVELDDPAGTVAEDEADRTKLKWFVNKHLGEIRYCYDQALKHDANLSGRIELAWSIEAGAAVDLTVVGDSIGSRSLAACIEERVAGWRFPPDLSGDVRWPFRFRR